MAAATFRVRLFNSIRDALYTTTDSSSAIAIIPSLDLIKIIARLAEPAEQLVVWRNDTLHSLDADFNASVIVDAPDSKDSTGQYDIPPIVVDFRALSAAVRVGVAGERRYIVSFRMEHKEIRILHSALDDTTASSAAATAVTTPTTTARLTPTTTTGTTVIRLERSDANRFFGLVNAGCIAITPPPPPPPPPPSQPQQLPAPSPLKSQQQEQDTTTHAQSQPSQQHQVNSLELELVGSLFVLEYRYNPHFELNSKPGGSRRAMFESFPVRFDLFLPTSSTTRSVHPTGTNTSTGTGTA